MAKKQADQKKSKKHGSQETDAPSRDAMFMATDTDSAPWYIVRSDDKRRARLNCIRHLLSRIPFEEVPCEKVEIPKCDMTHKYDDVAALASRRFVPEHY